MNIVERGKAFVQSLVSIANRTAWQWRRCPYCGSTATSKWGSYKRRPWYLDGRRDVVVARHRCRECGRTYSEESAQLRRRCRYAREVRRQAIDYWVHMGCSMRKVAEWVRSQMGKQERYLIWRVLEEREEEAERCWLCASTVGRWLDEAGVEAQESVCGQLEGLGKVRALAADGLWARLRGGTKRVVLLLIDSSSGVILPPLVALGEESARHWQGLFARACAAGLELAEVRGVTSDWSVGLVAHVRQSLSWLMHQRCLWHFWRNLRKPLAQACAGVRGAAGKQVRRELLALVHGVLDAASYERAEAALVKLREHARGASLAAIIDAQFDHLLAHRLDYFRGVVRVTPEWYWRDFRMRLSHGRNHGNEQRLERAALLWAIYHNFERTQMRKEKKRHYRHPGRSPLEVAGLSPGKISYLDALAV